MTKKKHILHPVSLAHAFKSPRGYLKQVSFDVKKKKISKILAPSKATECFHVVNSTHRAFTEH